MKPDHEGAKRYAAYIGDMARDHACDQDDVNLSAAYLDLAAREQRAVEFLQIIANWERTFDDPGAQAMADRIDAFLAERGEV